MSETPEGTMDTDTLETLLAANPEHAFDNWHVTSLANMARQLLASHASLRQRQEDAQRERDEFYQALLREQASESERDIASLRTQLQQAETALGEHHGNLTHCYGCGWPEYNRSAPPPNPKEGIDG